MARATHKLVPPSLYPPRQRWLILLLGLLLLLLAHGVALIFRIQPAVSLWFPPSGVAIALTLWLGPIGALLTWIAAFIVSPLWGNDGWARFASITDAIEPLVAWLIFYRGFKATLSPRALWNATAFLVSAPLIACGTSALLGTLVLTAFGKMSLANVPASIPHWWLGNALGTIVITPVALLLLSWSPWYQGQSLEVVESEAKSILQVLHHRWLEVGLVLASTVFFALLTVEATKDSIFATLQFSWLGIIPVFWAIARFGVAGSVMTASFSVIVTLVAYLLVYPHAITLPSFPVDAELLHTHKFSLLLQCVIALLAGTAITERSSAQVALEVEQIKRAETETRAQLSEELLKVNHRLNETNQQLQASEERFRTSVENMLDCFGVYSAIRNHQGEIVDFRVEYVNTAAQQNHLFNREAQTESASSAILPGNHDSDLFHEYCQVVETGQPLVRDSLMYEEQSGQHRLVRAFDIRIAKLGDGFVATWRDITELKQIENSLRQANEQFRLASEAVNSVIYDWDLQQNQIQRTSGMDRVFGYAPEEMEPTGEWYLALVHPDDVQRVLDYVQQAFASGDRYSMEYRIRNRQGEYLHVADQGLILRDETGQVLRVVGSVADISERARLETERKRVEAALQESENRYRMLAEAMPQMVWMADATGAVTYWNQRWYDYSGLDKAGSMGCAGLQSVHPDDQEHTLQQWQQAIADGETFAIEYRICRYDGVYRWFIGRAVPFRNSAGQITSWIGTITDIDDQKRIQEELHQNKERLSLALRSAQAGMWQWFRAGNRTIWSDENFRLLGYDPERDLSTYENWLNAVYSDDREMAQQAVDRSLEDQVPLNFEYRVVLPDGTMRWLADIGQLTYDADGNPDGMIGIQIDITERKAIETERVQLLEREQAARHQAESASRMKDEFLAIVSHELRSPLNGILGWSRLLRTRTLNADTTEKALASIERNAQAQTQLIEDLLDISRIIRGTVRLNLRPVNLLPIIQASLDTVGPTAEAKSIQLQSELNPNLGLVSGDTERLQQITWNLLSNAIKFTPAGGSVEVRLNHVDTHAQIQVRDTGKGISADFLPHVFDRFRQADSTTTRTQGGLGLGLAIVRSLVELHGGTIWAESAGEGQGATFIVELPLLPQERHQTNANFVPAALGHKASLEQIRVLIVDDEADTREFLTVALEQFGAKVTAAASASEAFQQFLQNPPDVLLSDIGMPEENGYTLIQKIRALPPAQGGTVPAAALTAYVRGDDRLESLKAGFQMHIPKPIEPAQLLQVVSQLVALRR
jgi:PAS domain S-box-containing protein